MRFLFALGLAYPPEHVAGAQQSIHDLIVELAELDVESAVLCRRSVTEGGGTGTVWDDYEGYPVVRAPEPRAAIAEAVEKLKPDIVVVSTGQVAPMVDEVLIRGLPAAVYFMDVEVASQGGWFTPNPDVLYLGNSRFVTGRMIDFGLDCEYVPNVVRTERYETEMANGNRVLFVGNHPYKGIEIAFRLAQARRDIPFTFVESWPVRRRVQRTYRDRAAHEPNVTMVPSVPDIRPFYGEARVLLVPSVWEESTARVINEAQINAIPVLASDRGGLVEAVGPGGIVVALGSPMEDWLAALDRIWGDDAENARLGALARDHARRPEMEPRHAAEAFLGHLTRFLDARRR